MNIPMQPAAQYIFGRTKPDPAEMFPVAEGVVWLRMAMPLELNHINLWMVRDGDGWAVIDAGFPHETTAQSWDTIMASNRLTRLICTHHHPDHMGLSQWLTDEADMPLWASHGEWAYGRMLTLDDYGTTGHTFDAHYATLGLGAKMDSMQTWRRNPYRQIVRQIPARFKCMRDGQLITIGDHQWRVMVGYGHSPEHCCLYCADLGVLIGGDMILPKITPNVSVWYYDPDGDPLRQFLDSLEQFRALPADTLVLPSHGFPYRGLHGRLDELIVHHDQQLDIVRANCARPVTAHQMLEIMYGPDLVSYPFFFALGEAVAHLNRLIVAGEVVREQDGDGTFLYQLR